MIKSLLKNLFLCLVFFTLPLFLVPSAFAANSVITTSPSSGSYAKPFTTDVVIDGHGDTFNAAQAMVAVSSNLAITDVVLGNCNFSFLKTPSTTNPSFAGIMLGKSSQKCTVYTMTLAPSEKGIGTIIFSDGSVKRYGDAENILASVKNANFTLTGAVAVSSLKGPTPMTITATPSGNMYTINLHIQTDAKQSLPNATVSLKNIATQQTQKAKTDSTGTSHFDKVAKGIYEAKVEGYSGENVLNISGSNHTLTLGINIQQQEANQLPDKHTIWGIPTSLPIPLLITGVLILGIVLGGGIFAIIFLILKKKKSHLA